MSALLELAERCEAATGAEADSAEMRKLNADILRVLGWREDNGDIIDPAGDLRYQIPYCVASLDAAMTLVPEGWRTAMLSEMEHRDGWHWRLAAKSGHARFGRGGIDGIGLLPALALCAAALRARASSEQ